jgi:PIN domain nuclease of toxin-antitoxin system
MSAIVSDTHALIWYLNNSPKLSPAAGLAFEQAQTPGELR